MLKYPIKRKIITKKTPKVYIAGKLNDFACDYIKNVHYMIKDAEEVRKSGFSIFVPGIDLLCGLVNGDWDYNDYFDNSQPWLAVADAIYVRGEDWHTSEGTKREILLADSLKIPKFFKDDNGLEKMIKYFNLDNHIDWVEPVFFNNKRK